MDERKTTIYFDLTSIYCSCLALLPPQILLDVLRLKDHPEYGEALQHSHYWKKVIGSSLDHSWATELSPRAIGVLIAGSSVIFTCNTFRIIGKHREELVNRYRFCLPVLIVTCVIGGGYLAVDIVDYMLLIIPLSIAVAIGIRLALSIPTDGSSRTREEKSPGKRGIRGKCDDMNHQPMDLEIVDNEILRTKETIGKF